MPVPTRPTLPVVGKLAIALPPAIVNNTAYSIEDVGESAGCAITTVSNQSFPISAGLRCYAYPGTGSCAIRRRSGQTAAWYFGSSVFGFSGLRAEKANTKNNQV